MSMNNPWLHISFEDYESHMSDAAIGQLQVLSSITKELLEKFKPASFALPGCTTGNGLEHINPEITKTVHAVDINPEYLQILNERYSQKIKNLHAYCQDINSETFKFKNINLCHLALVLEYVNPEKVLKKAAACLYKNGIISVVIQNSGKSDFVTKSKYESIHKLASIPHEINAEKIITIMKSLKFSLTEKKVYQLPNDKMFELFIFSR